MNELTIIVLATWGAGLASLAGGSLAQLEPSRESVLKQELIHGIVAFGGGILLAAVSFALVPEGMTNLAPISLAACFLIGGLAFCGVDIYLARRGGSQAQFLAMLMDFVPEAISLGAVFGRDRRLGILLAIFIGAQNLPEGFNAFRELNKKSPSVKKTLWTFFAISFLGPLAALTGHFLLQDYETITAVIMSVAAGGILYLIFQDIAPQVPMRRHWLPPLGAVLGFMVGMIGKQVLG